MATLASSVQSSNDKLYDFVKEIRLIHIYNNTGSLNDEEKSAITEELIVQMFDISRYNFLPIAKEDIIT